MLKYADVCRRMLTYADESKGARRSKSSRASLPQTLTRQSLNVAPQSLNIAPQSLNIAPQSLNIASQSLNIAPQSLNIAPQSLTIACTGARHPQRNISDPLPQTRGTLQNFPTALPFRPNRRTSMLTYSDICRRMPTDADLC